MGVNFGLTILLLTWFLCKSFRSCKIYNILLRTRWQVLELCTQYIVFCVKAVNMTELFYVATLYSNSGLMVWWTHGQHTVCLDSNSPLFNRCLLRVKWLPLTLCIILCRYCPSFLFYLLSVVPCIWYLELNKLDILAKEQSQNATSTQFIDIPGVCSTLFILYLGRYTYCI